jgi:large subunit ribosomal protein L35
MPKVKPNKGLLKRIKITKSGKVKFNKAFGRHRRSHKPGTLLRSYRRPKTAHSSDLGRVQSMLHISLKRRRPAADKAAEAASQD